MNITIIGIGKLGLCNALCFEKVGYNVLGVDIFPDYVEKINNKILKSYEPYLNEYLVKSKNFRATTSLKEGLDFSDIIFICVQTPNNPNNIGYDHTILDNLLKKINEYNLDNKHYIIMCTVMPKYIMNAKNILKKGTINYNPEFIAQGDIIRGFENPDIVLIGEENKESGDIIEKIYRNMNIKNIKRMKPLEAEITKIALNGFITTKIAYANFIGDLAISVDANPNIILNAIGEDSRVGKKYFGYGYSYGGPCFPRDTIALSKFAQSINIGDDIPKATHKMNEEHIIFQAKRYEGDVIEGVCYKENSEIPIIEESAKMKIAEILSEKRKITIVDKEQIIKEIKKKYGEKFKYEIKKT